MGYPLQWKASETLFNNEGLVGIKVEDSICMSGYCFPNVSKQGV